MCIEENIFDKTIPTKCGAVRQSLPQKTLFDNKIYETPSQHPKCALCVLSCGK